jgi:hypothetical protein
MRHHADWRFLLVVVVTALALSLVTTAADAQELVPRAYWPAPKGTNLLVVGYQYSSGDIVTDATLPIDGVDSTINYLQVSYQHTLSLFNRTANIQVNQPYTWGTTKGVVEGEFRRRDISALGDTRFLFSLNLRGAPSMDAAGFQALRAKPRTIIGASILVQPPTGGYDEDKAINAGTNRWAIKPEVGLIWPIRPTWLLEAHVGAWFFGENDEFLGTTRQQDPIVSTEFHLVKRVRPGFWASLDLNYYVGGETTVGQNVRADLQRNSRFGATAVFPFERRHAIRVSYSTGIVTESGGDYDTLTASYVYIW